MPGCCCCSPLFASHRRSSSCGSRGAGARQSTRIEATGVWQLRPYIATMTVSAKPSTVAASQTTGSPIVWLDGKWCDRSSAVISVYDHGLLYGDGVFEGIRVYGGKIFRLQDHLERL